MKYQQLYFMFLIFGTCLGQNSNINLKPYFSKSEITDLNRIADFFQKEFCGTSERAKFRNCINSTIPKLVDEDQKYLKKKISWRKQKKLYTKISDSTFTKIWRLSSSTITIVEPEYEYERIGFSYNKSFMEFVRYLEDSNPSMKGYANKLEAVGRFTPLVSIMDDLYHHPENTDLNNRGVQILLAIHFLTENDQGKRDKKALQLEKRNLRKRKNK